MRVKLKEGKVIDIGISACWSEKVQEKGGRYTCEMSRSELEAYFKEVRQIASAGSRRYFRGRRGGSLRGGSGVLLNEDD